MYKVIIIDDEKIVRNGIRDLIDWNTAGFEICAEGIDGRDGLEKILRFKPQLVLVDIKMPGLSGIEVIREARNNQFEGHFIILTGFSEFEFAKSAISLGVKEYLLKPVDERELARIVQNVYEDHQKREEIHKFAKEDLLRRILFNKEERQIIESQLKLYSLELSAKPYCAVIVREAGQGDADWDKESMEAFPRGWAADMEKVIMDREMVLICHGKHYHEWVEILQMENERVNKRFGKTYRISVGHDVTSWYDLCFSYEFARYLSENEFLFHGLLVVSPDFLKIYGREGGNNGIEHLATLLEIGDLDGIRESAEEYRKFCIRQVIKESEIKAQLTYNVVLLKERLFKKYKAGRDMETMVEDKLGQMISAGGFGELMELYGELLELMCRYIVRNNSLSVVRRVYHFMENNYKEDLRLKDIAKLFHYNSTYLGTVFKEETGETFKNTLDRIRISKAKKMLYETDLKVYQIAEEVGCGDLDRFYIIFKRYVGVSPKEYTKKKTGEKMLL